MSLFAVLFPTLALGAQIQLDANVQGHEARITLNDVAGEARRPVLPPARDEGSPSGEAAPQLTNPVHGGDTVAALMSRPAPKRPDGATEAPVTSIILRTIHFLGR